MGATRRRLLLAFASAAVGAGGDARAAATLGIHPRALRFPDDFGSHPDTRTEWWYITGTLSAGDRLHGFQITFFRSRTAVSETQPSRFAARQLLFAHAALTDLQEGRLRHDQRIARAGFGVAEAQERDTALVLRDWTLRRDTGRYRARAASEAAGFAFDLELVSTQPVLLQGEAGYSRKGPRPDQASHYYSEPQLAVSGTLTKAGKSTPVKGRAWLDHEWRATL